MIDISKLTESDKGARVLYRKEESGPVTEQGIIDSWDDEFVFVRYAIPCGNLGNVMEWREFAQATKPGYLEFAPPPGAETPPADPQTGEVTEDKPAYEQAAMDVKAPYWWEELRDLVFEERQKSEGQQIMVRMDLRGKYKKPVIEITMGPVLFPAQAEMLCKMLDRVVKSAKALEGK